MIVYFSATGHTEGAAKRLHEVLEEDLARLEPALAYSQADLDWTVENCRANREQRDQAPVPELGNRVELDDTSKLYLGFPIWWGIPARLIDAFLQSYDLGQRLVLPFCSSGSSPISEAQTYLTRHYPQVNWGKGLRYTRSLTDEQIRAWAA